MFLGTLVSIYITPIASLIFPTQQKPTSLTTLPTELTAQSMEIV
jgi:hypothetical protein